jgi:uncharacterized protein YbjT (DUF2867 family)
MILVTRATGNIGRHVVSQLLRAGATVRALTHDLESAGLPDNVVRGDPSVPNMLDACLDGGEAVFLAWPFFTVEAAPVFLDAITKHARCIVYLSSQGVGDDLEQQIDTITVLIATRLAA